MTGASEAQLFPIAETERSTGLLPSQMLRAAVRLVLPISVVPQDCE